MPYSIGMNREIRVGKQLKLCRETLFPEKTQEEVAQELGIGRDHLIKIEGDKKRPSFDLLAKMVEYYRTSFDFIFGNDRALKQEYIGQLTTMQVAERGAPYATSSSYAINEVMQTLPEEKQQAIVDIARIISRI